MVLPPGLVSEAEWNAEDRPDADVLDLVWWVRHRGSRSTSGTF